MIDLLGWTTPLARALAHSLWQGALVLAAAWVALRIARRRGAEVEGRLLATAVGLIVLLPWLTLAAGRSGLDAAMLPAGSEPVLQVWQRRLTLPVASWIVALWAAGVLAHCVRLLVGAWWLRRRVLRESRPIPRPELGELSRRAGLVRVPEVREWAGASGPFVTGCRRSVLVLPRGLDQVLGAEEWESLLLHELAHVARRDVVRNLLLRLLAALVWYQPAVWLLLTRLDRARERSCDDLAVRVMGAGLPLARALVLLEERRGRFRLAMAGTGGDFAARVRRILAGGAGDAASLAPPAWPLMLPLLMAASGGLALGGSFEGTMHRWARQLHAVIQAHDPAGPFTVELRGDRLTAATIDGEALPPERIVQRGSRVQLLDPAGQPELTLRVAPGGIHWTPRTPRSP